VRHFEEKLDELQRRLLEMAGLVESAIHRSVESLAGRDEAQARQVLQNEARINQMQIDIDGLATSLMALHQPMAKDLRFLMAAIKINGDLERMGDLAINIVERSIDLIRRPPVKALVDIPYMAELAESMVHASLNAFVKNDSGLARSVLTSDDAVDDLKDAVYQELMQVMQSDPSTVPASIDLMFVAHNLERIADHATNIAEDVLFLVDGIDVRHHAEQRP
jgi:phosphate transport system protein